MNIRTNKLQAGFTLIELLVVVAIIGILAAIAIPQYASYKKQAVDSKMKSDLHNAATAAEAHYGSANNTYLGMTTANLVARGYRQSTGLSMVPTGVADSFTLEATSTGGTSGSFVFDSATGAITP